MKKSKTIKLVLLTGLLGSAGAASGRITHYLNPKLITNKSFKGIIKQPFGYNIADTVSQPKHVGGSSFILLYAVVGAFGAIIVHLHR